MAAIVGAPTAGGRPTSVAPRTVGYNGCMADPSQPESDPTRLRLALTLPGAVSLGSYHGGAIAALLVAAQHAHGQLVIDAMATASAGSITGVLAARALLRGADPVTLMTRAWVEADSLRSMRSSSTASVLSAEPLRHLAADLLDAGGSVPDGGPDVARQTDPIQISMALASLGGLSYRVPSIEPDQPAFPALTHLDWWSGRFASDAIDAQFLEAADPALASAANALGFAPMLLDRSSDRETYLSNHINNLPPDGTPWPVWYTDGGTLDNEPFGRAIELVNLAEDQGDIPPGAAGDERLFLLVEPQPATVDQNGRWWNPGHEPNWTFTLFDVFNLKGSQSIYDDLLKLEKTNSHVQWTSQATETIVAALTLALDALGKAAPDRRADVEAAITDRLVDALTAMADDRRMLAESRDGGTVPPAIAAGDPTAPPDPSARPDPPLAPAPADLPSLVGQVIKGAAGLRGKRRARVEMVSPRLDGDAPPIADRLAGDFLFHFGGFVDEDFRRHDFLVGWSNMRTWLGQRAARHGFEPALAAVDRRRDELGWELTTENPSLGSLPLGDKWQLARTAAHVGHVISHDLVALLGGDEPVDS